MTKFTAFIGGRRPRFALGVTLMVASLLLAGATATVQAQNATLQSVSPSSGSGAGQAFTVTVTDPNSGTDVHNVGLNIMNGIVPGSQAGWSAHICSLNYTLSTGVIQLAQDAGGSFLSTTATAKTAQTVSNSQCTVIGIASSATSSASSTTVTVTFFVGFMPAFNGAKQLYGVAVDNEGNGSPNFQTQLGTYDVTATVKPLSVSPSSGSGAEQLFTAVYSDATAQIQSAFLTIKAASLINNSSSENVCGLRYDPSTKDIFLINDAGTSYGSPITSGSATPLSNSQCTVYGVGTSATTSGNNLTVQFNVSFAPAFDGLKQMDMGGADVNGNSTVGTPSSGSWLAGALTSGPACAASASGAGQIICVVSGTTGELFAVWQNEHPSPTVTTPATLANTAITYLDLGVTGTVGSSSCSSTADGTGDTVCAFNSSGVLHGIRFNVGSAATNTPQSAPVTQPLGISSVTGNASCAIGAARFTTDLMGLDPAKEQLADDTICAVRSTNGELMAVAFNPNVKGNLTAAIDLGFEATSDPSCTNPNIIFNPNTPNNTNPSNLVTCVANLGNALKEATFDPRPQNGNTIASSPSVQTFYSGTSFVGSPGCSAPSDLTGDVICAVSNPSNNLVGFAFNPQLPSTPPVPSSSPLLLSTSGSIPVIGNPSCAGFGVGPDFGTNPPTVSNDANSKQVLCAVRVASTNLIYGVEFDPRQSPVKDSGLISTSGSQIYPANPANPSSYANDPSCTFQNINSDTVSCASAGTIHSATPSANQWFVIPAVLPSVFP
jgi:hypothetical protein